jgi:uncharacterized coiled-coil protein SlyX
MLPFGLNKYVIYAVGAVVAALIILGYVAMWKASIKREALLQFNNEQLEQTLKEQSQTMENLKAVNTNQKLIIEQMNSKNEELSDKLKSVEDYLDSEETRKNNRPASVILKHTVKELSGQK